VIGVDTIEVGGARLALPVAAPVDGPAAGNREDPPPEVPLVAPEGGEVSSDRQPHLRRDVLHVARRHDAQPTHQR